MQGFCERKVQVVIANFLLPAHDKIEQVLPWHYHQVPGKRTIQTDFFNHYYMDHRIKNNKRRNTPSNCDKQED